MSRVAVILEGGHSSGAASRKQFHIGENRVAQIVKDHDSIALESRPASELSQPGEQCLGLICIDDGRINFEARVQGFTITPPSFEGVSASARKFHEVTLPRSTLQHTYTIILRPGDKIGFSSGQLRLDLLLEIEDDVKVDSSYPQAEGAEIAETQQDDSASAGISRRHDHHGRAAEHVSTSRTRVQVEQSIHESVRGPAATPAGPSQSQVVEETPTTVRHAVPVPQEDPNVAKEASKTISFSRKDTSGTNISTQSAIDDSFASRPKSIFGEGGAGGKGTLELRSGGAVNEATVPQSQHDDDETTESEDDVEDRKAESSVFSTTPEKGTQGNMPKLALSSSSHQNGPQSTTEEPMEVDHDPTISDNIDLDAGEDDNEETPRKKATRPSHPEVRIPLLRDRKRRLTGEAKPKATKKRRQEVDNSQDSMASSIKVRVGGNPPILNTVPTPVHRQQQGGSEQSTPAGSQTSKQSGPLLEYDGKAPRVAFSNTKVVDRDTPVKFLKKQGVQIVEKVTEKGCDIVCVGTANGTIVKSAKLLLGLVLDKTIVSDTWVTKSIKAQKLLQPSQFPPLEAPDEWDWGSVEETVNDVLNRNRKGLFKNKTIFVTPALKKEYASGFGEIEKVVKAAGAAKVDSKTARTYQHTDDTIILASEQGDLEAMTLSSTEKDRAYQCYSKDLISMSIIRGVLDLESDEFKIQPSSSQSKKGKGTGRKKKTG